MLTIAGKFLVRFRGKHVFNPTNGGLVAMLLLTDQVWVSPGQWGSAAFFAFLMACLGGMVVKRASRSDVTYAFIVFYGALLFGRSFYLGEPLAIPLHRLESGALLLFTFFMISDPKTTPDSRAGPRAVRRAGCLRRVVRAVPDVQDERTALVAVGVLAVGSAHRLAVARLAYTWLSRPATVSTLSKERMMKRQMFGVVLVLVVWSAPAVLGFCGFYVAKADTKLFNKASQVVLVRDGDRTVMTMVNDFKGDLKEFAVVIPVPTFLRREQIHVGDKALVDHLDAYSAPRLVEYFDEDPCRMPQ